ncbi:MAG TPA: glycosyltransferase family 4 protein [Solirubrobacterales bacterium]|jgi:glycosyltransferase involved in cell wall biosynthesis
MRILQIHNRYRQAGGEDLIADTEAELLAGGGHDVHMLRVENPPGAVGAAAALARAPWNRSAYRMIRERVREIRPDVAHVHNTWFALTPAAIGALADEGVPIVMEMQNSRQLCVGANLFRDGRVCMDCVGTHPWRGVAHACYRDSRLASAAVASTIALARRRGTWDRVDRFVAPSHAVKENFERAGYDGARITVKPTVVADCDPRPEPPSRSRTLIYAGRLSAEKGPGVLLAGWRAARLWERGFELELVGEGPLRAELERDAPPGVRFAGWRDPDDLRRDMLGARALLFPSQCFETFGRSIVEAFAAGLPVLATDIAGPGELAARLGPEWVVPPGSSGPWLAALERLADDGAVDAAGVRARALYEADYSLPAGLRRLEQIYDELIEARGSSAGRAGRAP